MKTIPNLDLARAFAILIVVCGHAGNWVEQIPDKIRFILYAGQYGVELFYALSGYLVGRIFFSEYFRNGSINFAHFLVKRGTKIIPLYLIVLLISYGGSLVFEGEQFRVEYLLLIQNYIYSMPFFWQAGRYALKLISTFCSQFSMSFWTNSFSRTASFGPLLPYHASSFFPLPPGYLPFNQLSCRYPGDSILPPPICIMTQSLSACSQDIFHIRNYGA